MYAVSLVSKMGLCFDMAERITSRGIRKGEEHYQGTHFPRVIYSWCGISVLKSETKCCWYSDKLQETEASNATKQIWIFAIDQAITI